MWIQNKGLQPILYLLLCEFKMMGCNPSFITSFCPSPLLHIGQREWVEYNFDQLFLVASNIIILQWVPNWWPFYILVNIFFCKCKYTYLFLKWIILIPLITYIHYTLSHRFFIKFEWSIMIHISNSWSIFFYESIYRLIYLNLIYLKLI